MDRILNSIWGHQAGIQPGPGTLSQNSLARPGFHGISVGLQRALKSPPVVAVTEVGRSDRRGHEQELLDQERDVTVMMRISCSMTRRWFEVTQPCFPYLMLRIWQPRHLEGRVSLAFIILDPTATNGSSPPLVAS